MPCPFAFLRPGDASPPSGHPRLTSTTSCQTLCLQDEHQQQHQQREAQGALAPVVVPPVGSTTDVAQTSQRSSQTILRTNTQQWLNDQGRQEPALPMAHSLSTPDFTTTQPWQVKRPTLNHCPKTSRRELRRQNRRFTLEQVAEHKYVDDIWIAVDGKVYDITEHLVNHDGWGTAGVSTPLSILAHGGIDCTEEFHQIHRVYPVAYKQLAAYYIGDLETASEQ